MQARQRWLLVLMLFIGGAISYLDRAALSIAAPLIAPDLHLSPSQLGIVFSAFFVGYAPFCFIGGYFSDRVGPKLVLIVAMTVWSVFCGLTAAATGLLALVVIRAVFGMGEGPYVSNISKLVSNWFPRPQQATAIAIANSGLPVGAALAGPVVGYLALTVGWRVAFIVIGGFGIVWVVAWMLVGRDRPEQAPDASSSIANAPAVEASEGEPRPLLSYLRRPSIIATAYAFFCYSYVQFFFLTWFPSYLSSTYHLSLENMALATSIPWIGNIAGLLVGGFVSDLLFRWTGRPLFARKVILVTGLVVAATCVGAVGLIGNVALALVLMTIGKFFSASSYNTYFAIVLDTVEKRRVGAVGGFVHFIANLAGIVAPALTGFLVQASGNFKVAFLLTGAVAISGAAIVVLFVRVPKADRPPAGLTQNVAA